VIYLYNFNTLQTKNVLVLIPQNLWHGIIVAFGIALYQQRDMASGIAPAIQAPLISGIAFNRDEAKLTLKGVPDVPGVASRILVPISDANIEVDMIVQNVSKTVLPTSLSP